MLRISKSERFITLERLDEVLDYDPESGIFRWKVRMSSRAAAGQIAGTICQNGYRSIQIDRQMLHAPHLAWWKYYRVFPRREVDHRDGDKLNDRILNLRLADRARQRHNSSKSTANTSGYKGVTWDKRRRVWVGQIQVRGKHVHLGQFPNAISAATAYDAAAIWHFGVFACTNFSTQRRA